MTAYYRRPVSDFLSDDEELILGCLTSGASAAGFFQQLHSATTAWQDQVRVLKSTLTDLFQRYPHAIREILLEYPIPRRGRRIDAVLLSQSTVVVLEFKCGGRDFTLADVMQVEDYCLDLRDFHKQSSGRAIVPVLVVTHAKAQPVPTENPDDPVKETWRANTETLSSLLAQCFSRYDTRSDNPIDPAAWDTSEYTPTPTIIEAAQSLYAGQNVREISRNAGGIENLTRTTDTVIRAVDEARIKGKKRICFITGVPGAGKTLAGLNLVHNHKLHEGELGVFLSGNGPLVSVLTEALARDASNRLGQTRQHSRRQVQTFIQNVHRFIDAYFGSPEKVPVDKVVVFDEAQRAWDAAQSSRKFNRAFSEPYTLLEVMDRHPDWAVVVALVGGGQEINRGEAGLAEWGRTLVTHFRHWEVFVSPELKAGMHSTGACLFDHTPNGISISEDASLHLRVNIRSYKAEALSEYVNAVLSFNPDLARTLADRLEEFPLVMTRDFERAKEWLRVHRRGHRRTGLIASSGARRLRAHGLDVTAELDVDNWFLNGPDDVRSSHFLEVPATEFGIQGLELDWTAGCWGGDLYPNDAGWVSRAFRGTKWQMIRDERTQRYVVNKYRVLLTRAREGTIIWVPPGDSSDPSRPPAVYNQVAAYLANCGIELLD